MKNVLTAEGGPYMMVVPESIMVWKLETTVFPPAVMLAPVACQNPLEVTVWYSMEPVYLAVSVPPSRSSEPVVASLNPKTPAETVPWLIRVLKKGFYEIRSATILFRKT